MAYETRFAIRTLAIMQNTWTDVVGLAVLPIDCNAITIYNNTGQAILFRSDPANANSQISIPDGSFFPIGENIPAGTGSQGAGVRFPAGGLHPAGSLQSASSGVSPIIESML